MRLEVSLLLCHRIIPGGTNELVIFPWRFYQHKVWLLSLHHRVLCRVHVQFPIAILLDSSRRILWSRRPQSSIVLLWSLETDCDVLVTHVSILLSIVAILHPCILTEICLFFVGPFPCDDEFLVQGVHLIQQISLSLASGLAFVHLLLRS